MPFQFSNNVHFAPFIIHFYILWGNAPWIVKEILFDSNKNNISTGSNVWQWTSWGVQYIASATWNIGYQTLLIFRFAPSGKTKHLEFQHIDYQMVMILVIFGAFGRIWGGILMQMWGTIGNEQCRFIYNYIDDLYGFIFCFCLCK